MQPAAPPGVTPPTAVWLTETTTPLWGVPPEVTVTVTPSCIEPSAGTMTFVGLTSTLAVYVKWSWACTWLVPAGVVTWTSTTPATPDGALGVDETVILVSLLTVNEAGLPEPNVTALAPVKFVPVRITLVPPVVDPEALDEQVVLGDRQT